MSQYKGLPRGDGSSCRISLIDKSSMKPLVICVILTLTFLSTVSANSEDRDCSVIQRQCDEAYYIQDTRISNDAKMRITHGGPVWKKCSFVNGFMERNDAMDCMAICDAYLDVLDLYGESVTLSRKKRDISNCYPDAIRCYVGAKYRTITGVGSPRVLGHCRGPLPSPRSISNLVHRGSGNMMTENKISYLVMQWGQFLAHDLILTPLEVKANGSSINCCGEDAGNPNCFFLGMPYADPHFRRDYCMNFVRSKGQTCQGVRQQINLQTSYIDASNVYGANPEDEAALRISGGGLLFSIGGKLGMDMDDSVCELSTTFDPVNYFCLRAGDARVNEQPGLISIHTLFQREHNRIVTALTALNPHWSNETLYQEARKIVAAEMQLITYKEWLPVVLGWKTMTKTGLYIKPKGFDDPYDQFTDPTIANEFGSAILRFGHSLIHDFVGTIHKNVYASEKLDQHFFDPLMYHRYQNEGTDYIMRWMSTTKCPFSDRILQGSARDTLFQDKDGNSFDLAALNIQRGRDHGLPTYNMARKYFGLKRAKHFGTSHGGLVDHDPDVASLLHQAYDGCVDNIDLFTGALTERRLPGSMTGPLMQLMLVTQFLQLKHGDRFWFERDDPLTGFTLAQLNSLKKTGLSSVLCANTNVPWIQENAFLTPSKRKRNKRKFCHHIPSLDLSLWHERTGFGYKWHW